MKKKYLLISSLVMALFLTAPVKAEEDQPLGISFNGEAEKFVIFQGNANQSAFEDMMPGEERTQSILIKNDNYESMKFYVKVDQTDLLNNDGSSQRIVYDINFKNNDESFFNGRIGGKQNSGKENLKENYLLKTLAKGESTTIQMTIKIDGTSMDNSYQGNSGDLGLVFSVETDTGNPVTEVIKKIPVINQLPGVNTGDATSLIYLVSGLMVSAFIIIILFKKGKKEEDNEKA